MLKVSVKYFLTAVLGVVIGWGISGVSNELNEIGLKVDNASDRINTAKFFVEKEKSDIICFEIWTAVSGLYEAEVVNNAKPILHWMKPSLLKKANQLENEMQDYLESKNHGDCRGLPYPVNETLVKLGYDV